MWNAIISVNLPIQARVRYLLDRFHEAASVFITFQHSVNLAILQYPQWSHYVTNGTLVNNNNTTELT